MKKLNIRVFCTFICLFMLFLGAFSYVVRIGTRTFISLTGKTNSFTAWLFKDQPTLNNQAENKRSIKAPVLIDWISISFFPPIFNIADSSLVIGAAILLVLFIIELVKEGIAKGKRGEYKYSPKELEKQLNEKKKTENNGEPIENSESKEEENKEEAPQKENE